MKSQTFHQTFALPHCSSKKSGPGCRGWDCVTYELSMTHNAGGRPQRPTPPEEDHAGNSIGPTHSGYMRFGEDPPGYPMLDTKYGTGTRLHCLAACSNCYARDVPATITQWCKQWDRSGGWCFDCVYNNFDPPQRMLPSRNSEAVRQLIARWGPCAWPQQGWCYQYAAEILEPGQHMHCDIATCFRQHGPNDPRLEWWERRPAAKAQAALRAPRR